MNYKDFLEQRFNKKITFNNYADLMHHFKFVVSEAPFTEKDYLQQIPSTQEFSISQEALDKDNLTILRAYQHASRHIRPIFFGINTVEKDIYKHNLSNEAIDPMLIEAIVKPETHIGFALLHTLRQTFISIYPFFKDKKNKEIEEKLDTCIDQFFTIAEKLPLEKMQNIYAFVPQAFFGKNTFMTFHESLLLIATHNFTEKYQDRFIGLINRVIPSHSVNDIPFASTLSSIIYSDNKMPLMQAIFDKINPNALSIGSMIQPQNHRNFYNGLYYFVHHSEDVLAYYPNVTDKKAAFTELFINNVEKGLQNIGMTNNAYYKALFDQESKTKLADILEKYDENEQFIINMSRHPRTGHTDFGAFLYKETLENEELFSLALMKLNDNMGVVSYPSLFIINKFNKLDDDKMNKIANHLVKYSSHHSLAKSADEIAHLFNKEQLFTIISASSELYKLFEKHYREKKLAQKFEENDLKNEIVKPHSSRNKI